MIFVSFYRGFTWMENFWLSYGPIIHATFAVIDFVLIPIIVIIQTLSSTSAIK